jgi:hypothetical protein
MRNRGATIVELLVALGIVALLVAIVVPPIQASREAPRHLQCSSHLRQIGIPISAYEGVNRMYPPGSSMGSSFHVAILPYCDQQPLAAQLARLNIEPLEPALSLLETIRNVLFVVLAK